MKIIEQLGSLFGSSALVVLISFILLETSLILQ
jgi:hypothetical protein